MTSAPVAVVAPAGTPDAGAAPEAPPRPEAAGVLARLGSLVPSLSESERKIAEYVLANAGEVVYLSITDLADRTDTSEATAIRFAQRLGFAGYAALKIALALDLRAGAPPAPGDLAGGDGLAAVKRLVFQQAIESLHDTAQLLDAATLERAVQALLTAPRIEIYGVGGSAAAAQDAYFALMRVGLPAAAITDSHLQIMSAVQLRPGDVAMAISQSGSTRDTVEALHLAREAGATCLCVTRYARSPITREAHITLLAPARPAALRGIPALSRIPPLAVIDTLAAAAALRRREASLDVLARGRQAIGDTKKC